MHFNNDNNNNDNKSMITNHAQPHRMSRVSVERITGISCRKKSSNQKSHFRNPAQKPATNNIFKELFWALETAPSPASDASKFTPYSCLQCNGSSTGKILYSTLVQCIFRIVFWTKTWELAADCFQFTAELVIRLQMASHLHIPNTIPAECKVRMIQNQCARKQS